MLKTDYSVVAKSYDQNADRHSISIEPIIGEILRCKSSIRILDVGCGTGNYIKAQNEYYKNNKNIEWFGIDPSTEMLRIAESKRIDAHFKYMNAEDLDFPDDYFDFIVCNFAFHHFERKNIVLSKVFFMLNASGTFKQTNICPELMKDWWVYKYCPKTYMEDQLRFWNKDLLLYELEKVGFKSTCSVVYEENYRTMHRFLEDYERRDVSQLAMIDDEAYKEGLLKLKNEIALGVMEAKNYFALLNIESKKIS